MFWFESTLAALGCSAPETFSCIAWHRSKSHAASECLSWSKVDSTGELFFKVRCRGLTAYFPTKAPNSSTPWSLAGARARDSSPNLVVRTSCSDSISASGSPGATTHGDFFQGFTNKYGCATNEYGHRKTFPQTDMTLVPAYWM